MPCYPGHKISSLPGRGKAPSSSVHEAPQLRSKDEERWDLVPYGLRSARRYGSAALSIWEKFQLLLHCTFSLVSNVFIAFGDTSLGVLSVLMWGCAGRIVGEHPDHHMKQDSRNTPNIPQCWNFSGARK
ncbi:hypothetical protein EYF80_025853 [Liparis tanakae]|uniref:Uncharacterized protein n=1 Tax=Liparis tanakae TaxID=230148 RepID=A0A4Z2HED6_9TELE|nr:hypothetical protein EYF80_025853 [Liparis tanakae]